jgi:hypothetical protein
MLIVILNEALQCGWCSSYTKQNQRDEKQEKGNRDIDKIDTKPYVETSYAYLTRIELLYIWTLFKCGQGLRPSRSFQTLNPLT